MFKIKLGQIGFDGIAVDCYEIEKNNLIEATLTASNWLSHSVLNLATVEAYNRTVRLNHIDLLDGLRVMVRNVESCFPVAIPIQWE